MVRESGIVALYSLIFFVLTYPLVRHFGSGIAGGYTSDAPVFLWNAWHLLHTLQTGTPFFWTDQIFFPHTTSLLLHTYTPVQSFITLAFWLITKNLVLSFNITYLFSTVGCAYVTYRFFLLQTKERYASFLAGQLFAFQPIWTIYTLFGTQNLLSLWYVPTVLYCFELWRQRGKKIYSALVGFVIALAVYNDIYAFAFCVVGVCLYAAICGIREKEQRWEVWLSHIGIAIATFFLTASYKIFVIIHDWKYLGSIPLPTVADVDVYHADIINIFRPTHFHVLWGQWWDWFRPVSPSNGNSFFGFTVLCIFLLVIFFQQTRSIVWQKKRIRNFFLAYLCILVISWGPFLHVWGYATHIPLPYWLAGNIWPQIRNLRVPMRWLLLAQLFLAGIVAYILQGIFSCLSRRGKMYLCILLTLGLVSDVLYSQKEIIFLNTPVSSVYAQIAPMSEGTVLEIPLAMTSGYISIGSYSASALAHQVVHGHPIIGGRLSRIPPSLRDEYLREPVIKYFLFYTTTDPDARDLGSEQIQHFFDTYQVSFIIFDKKLVQMRGAREQQLVRYITQTLLFTPYYEDQETMVFSLKKSPN